mmetsp:Transcript_21764/g.60451  ORF Transcript_21764/g.60451 Transcript_21764/m.60451 type:complete len:192 (-) Transcript_21764:2497-3072(-)
MADDVLHPVLHSQLERMRHRVGQYNHVLCKERNNGIPHVDTDFNFDFEKNKEVIRALHHYCDNYRVPYYNFDIRTTKRDNAMLSCCQGRDAMWIDFQAKADVSREFFGEMEDLLRPIGFRKYWWAKGMHNTNPEYVYRHFKRAPVLGAHDGIRPGGKVSKPTKRGLVPDDAIGDCRVPTRDRLRLDPADGL